MRRWVQNAWRLMANPYAFFEDMINQGTWVPATGVFLTFLLFESLGWWLVGRDNSVWFWTGSFLVPLLTYPVAVLSIYLVCHWQVRENHLSSFFAVWGFSYLPTFLFFSLSIILHGLQWFDVFAAIPNWLMLMGMWTFIFLMLLWKLLLLSITLRLAGNLNLKQIILAILILGFIVIVFWWAGLSLGLLKVPNI